MGGNNKFRLSDMIPPAWLRKIKTFGSTLTKPRALPIPPPDRDLDLDQTHQRKSYHFSWQFDAVQPRHPPSTPRRSTSKHRRSALLVRPPFRRSTPRRVTVAVSSGRSCRALADFDTVSEKNECRFRFPGSPTGSLSSTDDVFPRLPALQSVPSSESFDQMVSLTTTSSSCRCRADLDGSATLEEGFDTDPLFELDLELPAVIAKPAEFNEMVMNLRRRGQNKKLIAARSDTLRHNRTVGAKIEQKNPRRRMQVHSPKLAMRKSRNAGSKSMRSGVSTGLAVVKSSVDPWNDFRDSMSEMIAANGITSSKDLEELLACYLMLNSDEYHDLIVGVFQQIWFDLYGARARSK